MRNNVKPSFWARRSQMEKRLLLLVGVVGVLALGFLAALVASLVLQLKINSADSLPCAEKLENNASLALSQLREVQNKLEDTKQDICFTPGCIHTASKLLSNMNEDVDPCDDFYDFACGTFEKKTRIPDDKTSVNTFSIITDELQEQIRTLLEEPITSNDCRSFVLAKTMYQACMNQSAVEARGFEPLLTMLRRLGGWPLLDGHGWDEQAFSWQESVYKFRRAGYSVDLFIDFSVGIDVKNSSRRVIDLDQASLGMSREYLSRGLGDKIVRAYYEYMVDVAVILGANRRTAEKELKESLEFEMKLANISLPLEERRNATLLYNPMTLREMQEKFPSIPWVKYINRLLAPHVEVTDDEIAIVNVPTFITNLEALLARTPKRTQANYIMWRATASSISYLSETLRKRQLAYVTALTGKTEREARWKECSNFVGGSMSLAVGALYIKKYFNEASKKNALEMVEDIRMQFREILSHVDWMDETTRAEALYKADSMASHIAYPPELLDDDKLDGFYAKLEMNKEKLMESILNVTLFGTEYSFSKLRKPVNKSDWVTHGNPAIVNAFYSSIENSIQFPAGILQGTFFSAHRPAYMNYGAIGFVIGHEITHGFDDQGRQFDKNGNLVDWWQETTKQKYLEKAKCIIDQYSNYTVKEVGMKLNGINTQGENIADNGGIKEAYLAYNAWTKRHGEEARLPGLDYSPRQLFWLSAANTWCNVYRKEALVVRIVTGFHSPGRFRVVGPFSNMDDFARDFKCPPGSPMNPLQKCSVW